MRHGSLFSGIGGFDLASQWAGWDNVFQVEIDEFCQKVLTRRFPNVERFRDIRDFDGTKWKGAVDIISGEDTEVTEKYLIDELKKISYKKNTTIAIITKTNRDLERILHLCEIEGIPVSSERSIDIFSHPAGALFFDLIEFISDPTKFDLLSKTLISGLWGLSFEDSVELIKSLKAGKNIELEKKIPAIKIIRKMTRAET